MLRISHRLTRFSVAVLYLLSLILFLTANSLLYSEDEQTGDLPLESRFAKSSWKNEFYNKFHYLEFKKFEPANRKIDPQNPDLPLLEAAVFYESNLMRNKYELPYFRHSTALQKSSLLHSQDMATKPFFSIFHPESHKKKSPDLRMSLFGVDRGYRAENIAKSPAFMYKTGDRFRKPLRPGGPLRDFETRKPIPFHTYNGLAEIIVDGWMKNSGYRKNILDKRFRYMSVGSATRADSDLFNTVFFYVTQDFASHLPESQTE